MLTIQTKPSNAEMQHVYQQYITACNNIPDSLYSKLEYMPNNKGFIVNGIWLFGLQRPSSRKIHVLFEKIYPYLYIHEITKRNYKITCMDLNTKERYVVSNNARHVVNVK